MGQQKWIITVHNDSMIEASQHAEELKELLLDASRHITVSFILKKGDTQSGIGDTIVALLPSGAIIAAINAIKQFFLRNHQNNASIELEIKEMKFKATRISEANYKYTLDELLKYAQMLGDEEE